MKQINKFVLVLFSIFMLVGSGIVSASCSQADAKGTWRIHAIVWDVFGDDEMESFKCKVKVGSSGGISASKSSCRVFTAGTVGVTGGKIELASNCSISGNLKTNAGKVNFRSGQMDRSKNSITLVGVDSLEANIEYFMDGIKQ